MPALLFPTEEDLGKKEGRATKGRLELVLRPVLFGVRIGNKKLQEAFKIGVDQGVKEDRRCCQT